MPSSRLSCSVRWDSVIASSDLGAFFTGQQGDDLELGAGRRRDPSTLRAGLDLAYGTGEHRQDALATAGAPLRCVARSARTALASCGQVVLL